MNSFLFVLSLIYNSYCAVLQAPLETGTICLEPLNQECVLIWTGQREFLRFLTLCRSISPHKNFVLLTIDCHFLHLV